MRNRTTALVRTLLKAVLYLAACFLASAPTASVLLLARARGMLQISTEWVNISAGLSFCIVVVLLVRWETKSKQ